MIQHGAATSSNALILSNATVMLGAMGESENLTPQEHSIGLFKELVVNVEMQYTQLMQGIRQQVVDEQITGQNISVTGSGFQFGLKQMMYGLGMDGESIELTPLEVTNTLAATEAATTLTLSSVTGLAEGDTLVISPRGNEDASLVSVITDITGSVVTMDRGLPMAVPASSKVHKGTILRIGGDNHEKAYKSMKVVAHTTRGKPVTFLLFKVSQSNSFSMALGGDYAKIPYTFKSFSLTPDELGYDQYIANDRCELMYIATA